MMIGNLMRYVFLLPLLCGGGAIAHTVILPGGTVHMTGSVIGGACAVSTESEDKKVLMGQVRNNQFKELGSWADPVAFSLELVNCDTKISQQVGMIFTGVLDGKDPLVFHAGEGPEAAKGVGIGIFDSSGSLIVPETKAQHLTLLQNGTVTVPLMAKYRATDRIVEGGDASAVVYFSLYYP
ncbi:fimbrial protein [Scandinavium sp. V105_16]|uniref:Fimbrial protein n=2 Tax=Scandinavium lactucae TaxID=3095028 RepID=A0AAJ2S6D0_9ENTR|nr:MULTISPECIES: fimbrial protein [unclassified Scandinavium]MDX6020478.1 fimbrial protein [Scandinavium sp. V105_16]MDX6031970.1 fimbrial protein [Scandinavium sp. V105_12]MDX6051435.1 fimbrial protein [Scandinavium sp. V105_1]